MHVMQLPAECRFENFCPLLSRACVIQADVLLWTALVQRLAGELFLFMDLCGSLLSRQYF